MIDKMRRIFVCRLAVSATILLFAAALSAQATTGPSAQASEWKTYTYPAAGFIATYPSKPEVSKMDVPTAAGSFELRMHIARVDSGALFVVVSDLGSAIADKDPDVLLQGAKAGDLKTSHSHIVSERKITLGVYHGLAFESESDAMHCSERAYIVGTTVYQTFVIASINKPYDGTTRFLDSFQLIARTSK